MIPQVSMGGVFQIDTGSFNSIVDLNSSIDWVRSQMAVFTGQPRITGVPLWLRRVPTVTRYEGSKATHYCMQLAIALSFDELKEMGKRIAAPPIPGRILIDAPPIEEERETDLIPASLQVGEFDYGDEATREKIFEGAVSLGWDKVRLDFNRRTAGSPEKLLALIERGIGEKARAETVAAQEAQAEPEKKVEAETEGPPKPKEADPVREVKVVVPASKSKQDTGKAATKMLLALNGGNRAKAIAELRSITKSLGIAESDTFATLKTAEALAVYQVVAERCRKASEPKA
jgi:hypothetical protein